MRGSRVSVTGLVLFVTALSGCDQNSHQSALSPAGPAAADIALLWWVMLATFTVIFIFVVVLLLIAVLRQSDAAAEPAEGESGRRRGEGTAPPLGYHGFVLAGGIVLPVVVLVPLLF